MKQPVVFTSSLLATLCVGSLAHATEYFASPTGTGTTCSSAAPCTLASGVSKLAGGDILTLADGTYTAPTYGINVTASGSASAYTTVRAAANAVPIIKPSATGSGSAGIGASTATYVRFQGLAVQGFATGLGNGWTGGGTTNSNGNIQFVNCIADGNTKTGIAFQSAKGVLVQECIVAHNGSSTTTSWSSGVDLFGAQGAASDNLVQRNVAFENVDMQRHTDGSGFIADDIGTGASFINNIGFRNGGSCIRLTTSTGTYLINNSCYHDGLDPAATGPSTPGEIFFSSATTQTGAVMVNNLAAASGYNNTQNAFYGNGSIAISPYNIAVNANAATPFYTDPAGTNPDFRLTASATAEIDKGTTTNAPTNDIGFDPKCITKAAPSVTGVQSWWIYSIDYTYIKSVGGIAGCFHPSTRTGVPDIGAYEYNGTAGTGGNSSTGGATSTGGSPSTGGVAATGGTSSVVATGGKAATGGSSSVVSTGGSTSVGATGGKAATGGAVSGTGGASIVALTGGSASVGGAVSGTGGGLASPTGGSASVGGALGTGGQVATLGGANGTGGSVGAAGESATVAGNSGTGGGTSTDVGSCSCRVVGARSNSTSLAGLGLLGLLVMRTIRRRRER